MILTVVGTRPQFIKASAVSKAFLQTGIKEQLIHTGQHFDDNMSRIFFDSLQLPTPALQISIQAATPAASLAQMIEGLDAAIQQHKPVAVLVYGDSDSTLAGAIAANKNQVPLIHVEAGLRSNNYNMPEEWNRLLTDKMSDLLLCSHENAVTQLKNENCIGQAIDVGDVMYDVVLQSGAKALKEAPASLQKLVAEPYALLTLHRPVNVDDITRLQKILSWLSGLYTNFIWPVHPRTAKQIDRINLPENIITIPAQGYLENLFLLENAEMVITDSGGLQKEAYWLQKRCITLRDETEWKELVETGWNQLAVWNEEKQEPDLHAQPLQTWQPLYGDGDAATKIAVAVKARYSL
jgi:UDP-GlcNAc3NAcA epimerase